MKYYKSFCLFPYSVELYVKSVYVGRYLGNGFV